VQGRGGQPHEIREPHVRKQFKKQPTLLSTSQNCGSYIDHCLRKHSRRFLLFSQASCASRTRGVREPHRGHCRYRVFNYEIEDGTTEDALQSFTTNTYLGSGMRQLRGNLSYVPLPHLRLQHSTVGSRFTTALRSRIVGCKSNRRKTSTI